MERLAIHGFDMLMCSSQAYQDLKSRNGRKVACGKRFFVVIDAGSSSWVKARETVDLASSW